MNIQRKQIGWGPEENLLWGIFNQLNTLTGIASKAGGGGGTITSVSNSDGTLTISPTTGAVVASLNLAQANTWSSLQTFTSGITTNGTSNLNSLVNVAQNMNFTGNATLSVPVVYLTGSIVTGGTGTTTTPYIYYNKGASAPSTWSTNGTLFGANVASSFTGNFIDFHLNGGSSLFSVNYQGNATINGNLTGLSNKSIQYGAIAADGALSAAIGFNSSVYGGSTGINFVTNGALRGAWFQSGNFAIGTTTDNGYSLDVRGTNGIYNAGSYTSPNYSVVSGVVNCNELDVNNQGLVRGLGSGSSGLRLYAVGNDIRFEVNHSGNYTAGGINNNFQVLFGDNLSVTGGSALTYNSSALMQLSSTTKGFLPPVMTTTQKNAISIPAEGLFVYDNVLHTPYYYNGSAWTSLGGASNAWLNNGNSFGTNSYLGTKDNYDLTIIRNNNNIINVGSSLVTIYNSVYFGASSNYFNANLSSSNSILSFKSTILQGYGGTNTYPMIMLQSNSASAVNYWNNNGTYIGINSDSGWQGDFISMWNNGNTTPSFKVSYDGSIYQGVGAKITIPSGFGFNARQGQIILSAGTATVSTNAIAISSYVYLQRQSTNFSSQVGHLAVLMQISGSGFTIQSYDSSGVPATGDNSVVNWFILDYQ